MTATGIGIAASVSFKKAPSYATAVRVTRSHPVNMRKCGAPACAGSRSGGLDRLRLELGAHGAAQQIQQHDDAVLIAQLDEPPNHVLKGAGGDPHELAKPQRVTAPEAVE